MPHVVIVDDQATDRQILDRLTRNLAADVETSAFARPREALAWLREHQPDLLLVDYRMPEMDGVAFVEAVNEIRHCAGIPVVVITVVDDSDLRYRALAAGATDVLTKPLDLQECEARCRNLLTLRRQQITIAQHAAHLAEARRRTGRALRTLSLGNELLVGTGSDQDLLDGVCSLVAEEAGYPCVSVGLWDDEDRLHEVARAPTTGATAEALPRIDDWPLAGQVREDGQVHVIRDLAGGLADPATVRRLMGADVAAAALLPVPIEGIVHGVLLVLAEDPAVFDPDEIELLVRTANNLGYGLAARRAHRARARAERDARYLTHFDRLTGLPNRNRLLVRLRELMESDSGAHEAALLAINLDRFKLVNDTTGHEAGDELLLQVVRRLQAILRARDVLARHAGDEFVLLVTGDASPAEPDGDVADDAVRVARRVIDVIRRPIRVAGYDYYIGASVGISRIDAEHADLQAAVRQADTAMRHAKQAGGNRYTFYTGELTERHTRRLSLESRLHRAIEHERFVLHFQPIVEIASARPVGVEALVRWPQEDGSTLAPDAFIPVAEETGLMERLGHWVFRAACAQARVWQQAGLDLQMSVNLSVHQLLRPNLARTLAGVMDAHGVEPSAFELEVTESAMMTDPARTERIVGDLHERGCGIALDDFGIGYSSLSRLKHLPITTLKIDKDFLPGLPSDPAEHTIVRSIVQLAASLRVRAVAEGVESAEHVRVLTDMGCRYGQGFHFSHPLPAEALSAWVSGDVSSGDDQASGGRAP